MQEIIQTIKTSKIIAIVRGVESSRLIPLAEALYDGGIRLMEITYSADGSVSDAETSDNIGSLNDRARSLLRPVPDSAKSAFPLQPFSFICSHFIPRS